MDLSQRIAHVQQLTGWSNAEIARHAGVSRTAPGDWKSGKASSMSAAVAGKLAKATGFDSQWLATGDGEKPITYPVKPIETENHSTAWPFSLVDESTIRSLSDVQRASVEGAILLVLGQMGFQAPVAKQPEAKPVAPPAKVPDAFPDIGTPAKQPPRIAPAQTLTQARRPLRLSRKADVIAPPGTDADNDYVAVPMLPIRPAAGPAREHFYERPNGSVLMSREFLESFKLPIERMKILHAEGKSMQPDIPDAAPMLYFEDDITRLATIDRERAYVINYGGEIMVKLIAKGIAGNWVARSINQEFGDISLERDDGTETRVLGYVLWTPPADPLEFS